MTDEDKGTPETESAPDDLRAELEASMDALEKGANEPEVVETETEAEQADRVRDEKGRFTAKAAKEGEEEAPAQEAEAAPAEQAEQPEKAAEKVEAPAHWKMGDRDTFNALDPKGQEFLIRRHKEMEADYTRKLQDIAPLRSAAQKWEPYFRQIGASPDVAFDRLVAAEYQLRSGTPQQKQAMLVQLANDYGISFSNEQTPAEQQNPHVQALEREVATLRNAFTSLQGGMQTQQLTAVENQIEAFRNQKTEAGQLAHPYFADVEAEMTMLARIEREAGRTPELKTLYERAVRMNDAVWSRVQAAQQTAAAKKEASDKAAKAKRAQSAAASVPGSPSGVQKGSKNGTVRDDIEAAFEKHYGAA